MIDTIFALSSGRPPAGIAIIRISGPQAFDIHTRFCRLNALPEVRRATLVSVVDPVSGHLLDRALALIFAGPHSVTGEDMVEWHCHGGHAVVQAVLHALRNDSVARDADAGEFTRRAFENGRIDLNEAEGLADLLAAETETQRRAALAMADGHFSRRVEGWRSALLELSAQVEAVLDFSDEDDVAGEGMQDVIASGLAVLAQEARVHLALPSAERLRDGIRTVIAGPPNAGKSTLLNALAGREAAIVSDIAGTTRDRIEVPVSMGGISFLLTDTAGLRDDSTDSIEAIGMDRARSAVEQADIVLWLGPSQKCPRIDAVRIAAQCDRQRPEREEDYDLLLSAVTGEGMAGLVDRLVVMAQDIVQPEAEYALHQRQRDAVRVLREALDAALATADALLIAENLRIARGAMDRLTGRAGVEDMLDSLFGRFCIGK